MNHIDQIKAYYGKTAARQDYQKAMSTFLFLKEHEAHEKGRALSKSVTFSWLAHMEKFLGRDSRQYWEAVKEALLTGYGPLKTRISPTAVVGTGRRARRSLVLALVRAKALTFLTVKATQRSVLQRTCLVLSVLV